VAALAVIFMPRQNVDLIRGFVVAAMGVEFLLSLLLLRGDYSSATLQFTERYALVPKYGITYSVGVDGLSLWLVLLTTFITPLATYAAWTQIDTKIKEFAISLLILESVLLGGFVALDLFLFYVCWELTLGPTFFIIGMWGHRRSSQAAAKFLLFTMAGSSLMLVALLYLAAQYKAQTGQYSFELRDLKLLLLPGEAQLWLFAAFALAFAIKVPMFPFHAWLPDAYAQAPTAGTVMLSALMAKLATYGFLRFAMPLFPSGSHQASATLAALATAGIIYGAFCAWGQTDLKRLLAYSSLSHLGFVMLGIYTLNANGLRGSIVQMINHGISTAALFLLVGCMYDRRGSAKVGDFGGVAKVMPLYAAMLVIATLSAIGLPTTSGFVGEFMVLAGAFMSDMLGRHGPIAAVCAATGLVLAPIYLLKALYKVLWGPLSNRENESLADLTLRERVVILPLVALIFYIGLVPNHVLRPMSASVDRFAVEYLAKLRAGQNNPTARALLDEHYAPAHDRDEHAPTERASLAARTR
jgi:NADH-quinone oxidoreductase subunit M